MNSRRHILFDALTILVFACVLGWMASCSISAAAGPKYLGTEMDGYGCKVPKGNTFGYDGNSYGGAKSEPDKRDYLNQRMIEQMQKEREAIGRSNASPPAPHYDSSADYARFGYGVITPIGKTQVCRPSYG